MPSPEGKLLVVGPGAPGPTPERTDSRLHLQQIPRPPHAAGGGRREVSLSKLAAEESPPEGSALADAPRSPQSVEEAGLDPRWLLKFLLKGLYVFGIETVAQAEERLKLPRRVLDSVFEAAKAMRLVEILGLTDSRLPLYRYSLTSEGRQWALDALEESLYSGPAPVPLGDYQVQVRRQLVANERVDRETLSESLSHLILPPEIVSRLGPALSSAKAILLYGAPGNGKTSIAEALARCFRQTILVPHCVEVDGQIVKIFDPAIHEPVEAPSGGALHDERWVRCRRPAVLTGGELTIEMLDLSFDPVSKCYEAPSHIKATGGIFIIDDFGRQRVRPRDLLNRWILPLERRIDFLTLHTGKKLRMPFDEVVIFSTNFPPHEIMDEAALRRIEYKLHIPSPTPADFETIFRMSCAARGLEAPSEVIPYVLETFYPQAGIALSGGHPRCIIEHALAQCAFERVPPELSVGRVRDALRNLVLEEPAAA